MFAERAHEKGSGLGEGNSDQFWRKWKYEPK